MVRRLDDEFRARADAELELRERRRRRELEVIYDWYSPSCPCGLPPGECRLHPRARPKQRPPAGRWRVWVMRAGRGGGKTLGGAKYIIDQVQHHGVGEIVLVNATIGDTRDFMVEGPSGLLPTSPPWFMPRYIPSKARVEWPNGAKAFLRTSEEPDGLRGFNSGLVWGDEPGKWQNQMETWNQIGWILRNKVQPPPRCVLTGTPTPTPLMFELEDMASPHRAARTGVHMVVWHTRENASNLDKAWLASQEEQWAGTLMGQQELAGELIMRKPGALWVPEEFDRPGFRVSEVQRDLFEHLAVAVDPASGSDDERHASEAGIVVGVRSRREPGQLVSRAVVLDDRSTTGKPGDWGRAVVRGYYDWGASEVIAEKNQGGEMVRHVIESVPAEGGYPSGKNIPIKLVFAAVGKMARAEPIQALYQAGRVRHLRGPLDALERQMVQYLPGKGSQKLDRVDALVWLLAEILLAHDSGSDTGPVVFGGQRPLYVHQGYLGQPWDDF